MSLLLADIVEKLCFHGRSNFCGGTGSLVRELFGDLVINPQFDERHS